MLPSIFVILFLRIAERQYGKCLIFLAFRHTNLYRMLCHGVLVNYKYYVRVIPSARGSALKSHYLFSVHIYFCFSEIGTVGRFIVKQEILTVQCYGKTLVPRSFVMLPVIRERRLSKSDFHTHVRRLLHRNHLLQTPE